MSAPAPGYETDPRVDDYIDPLPDWQRTYATSCAI